MDESRKNLAVTFFTASTMYILAGIYYALFHKKEEDIIIWVVFVLTLFVSILSIASLVDTAGNFNINTINTSNDQEEKDFSIAVVTVTFLDLVILLLINGRDMSNNRKLNSLLKFFNH